MIRYDQAPALPRLIADTDIFCLEGAPFGVGAPFYKAPFTAVATYISSKLAPLFFAGTWNATTNTPTLVSSVGINGAVYLVNVSGNTNLNGHSNWVVGDWAVFDGNINEWTQVANDVIATVNIYNSDGSLTAHRTLDTNAFNLIMNGSGNINLDVPNLYLTNTSSNSTTVGSNTFDGIANQGAQTFKGKFNVVVDDETGVYGTSLLRFSQSYPNIFAMGKAEGTEAAPLIVTSNTLVSVMAHAVYDGTSFSGKPNFNPIIEELFFAADGQAAGNSPGAYIFGVTLSGNGTSPTPFMTFNLSSKGEAAFGPNTAASGLNSVVLGNNISTSTDNEVLIGNTLGVTTISCPAVNLDSPQVSMPSAPYSGGGVQYLTVDNSGKIVPDGGAGGINIYNSDGGLTSDRTLSMNGVNLQFVGTSGEQFVVNVPDIQLGGGIGSSMAINATTLNLNSPNLTIEGLSINFTAAQYVGSGTQYLAVDNSGILFASAPPPSTNIYNSDGSLTADRTLTLNGHNLTINGAGSESIYLYADITQIGVNNGQFLTITARASLAYTPFNNGTQQFVGTDGSGNFITLIPRTIYTADGALNANRIVTLIGNSLRFTGNSSSTVTLDPGTIDLGLSSSTNLQLRATTFINQSGFIGGGNQYIGVNNSGQLQVMATPGDTNIYNTDGTLTATRTLSLGSFDLILGSALTSLVRLNSSGIVQVSSSASLSLATQALILAGNTNIVMNSDVITVGGSSSALTTFVGGARFTTAPFTGAGTQYLTVNNTGNLVPVGSPPSTNIYNSDGSLSGNRIVTLASSSLSFSGTGGVTIGSGNTATAPCSFAQGNTNSSTGVNSVCLGGLLNSNAGVDSGIFASNGSTISAGTGTVGYGVMLGSYNSIGFDNQTVTIGGYNAVNYGQRSMIFGGQTNKINAPNTLASSDCFIFGGITNTITGNVTYGNIMQSVSCVIGDNSNAVSACWIMNSGSTTLLPNAAIGNTNMIDINGISNTVKAHYAVLINSTSNTITSAAVSGGGRYLLFNTNNMTVPDGNYVGALSSGSSTLNGNFSMMLSALGCAFASTTTNSSILSGANHTNAGTNCAVVNGDTNSIGNVQNSLAIGSNCTITHNECILINDGGAPLASAADRTTIIQAENGVAIGKGTNNPNRDVVLGKKVGLFAVNVSLDTNTASTEAVVYNFDTSGGNKTLTLDVTDTVGGAFFMVSKTSSLNFLSITPASGTINGSSSLSLTLVGLTIITCDGTNWYAN